MDLSELERARPVVAFSPHPLLLAKERELVYAHFLPNETLLAYLKRTGLLERMGAQPFILTLDGRALPRALWARCRPKPGTLINLTAMVRGGDGKKNPIATIAMIALTVYAPQLAGTLAGPGAAASTVALYQAGIMVVGSMAINALFPPPRPDLARAQNLGGGDSPNYAIAGGSNRMRRYEPMPKICGVHRVFPDFGAQPYSEFEGADQVGYYVFDLGYNDCELTDFKIGDTPIEEFEGVEMEISGADGKLALFPGNVDTVGGVELAYGLGFVSRTSSPQARSLAVELTGALFFLGDTGTEPRQATVDIEYRAVGSGSWTALAFASDATPATSVVNGVARVPASQYRHGVRKAITGQPADPNTAAAIWSQFLTVLSASGNVTPGDYWLVVGVAGLRWQEKPGGPGFQTGPFIPHSTLKHGGQFLLYNGDRTQSLLVEVKPYNLYPAGLGIEPGQESTLASIIVGSSVIAGQFMLVNASREPLRRTFKWHVAEGQYEVRVRKSTPDEVSLRATAQIVWSALRTYQPDAADYTGRLRVGLKVRASALANGVLQQLSCIARAKALPPDFEWAGPEDDPALAFDFLEATLEPKVGEAAITFTRAGATATRVNEQGLIETVPADTPRWDYDPVTKALKGLLVEEARANLCLHSNEFTNWGLTGGGASPVQNADGPLGPGTAWTLTDDDAGAFEGRAQSWAVADDSLTHVFSIFIAKTTNAPSAFGVNFGLSGGTNVSHNIRLNTNSGNVTGGGSPYVEDWGDSWRLVCSVTNNSSGNTLLSASIYPATRANVGDTPGGPDDASATGSAVVSAAQLEKASFPTSYIPTTAASVFRNTDNARVLDIGGFYNVQEGTVACEWSRSAAATSFTRVWALWESSGPRNEIIFVQANTGANGGGESWVDGSGISIGGSYPLPPVGEIDRHAVAFRAGDGARSANGGSVGTTALPGLPDGITTLALGNAGTGGSAMSGHLRRFTYYRKRVSNAALEKLSADGPEIFARQHTSNPAWWVLDAHRGKTVNGRRVFGGGLADSRIDIEGLKAFAAWCDAEGLEFNGVFDQQVSLYELVSAIALQGRATPTMQTGKHGVLWDAPDLPTTAVFGMHNIVAGSFEIEYATGDLADVIEVWFINPELNWQRDFVRALVPGATSQARVRRVEAFGCTAKAQAGWIANLYAAANAYRARRYKWRSDWEQMICPRGDVALLGHDLLQLLSGRFVEGGDASSLKLARKVPLYDTGAHVTVRKPDGSFSTHAVQPGTGESDTLALVSPLPFNPWADPDGYPPYDYRWHYGPSSTTGRKVKIESFKPVSERYVDVTAVDEDPAYYAAKDNALAVLPDPSIFGQVQLQSLNVTEDGVRTGTGYLAKVLVSWDVTGDYGFADVRAGVNGAPMELVGDLVRGRSFSFNVQDFSDIVVEVTAWSSFGRLGKSSKLTVEHRVNYAGQSPPSDVTDFFLDGHTFRWVRAPEVDVVGSRIRFHYGENQSFADANELHKGLLASSPATFEVLPSGTVTFFCTEVDAAGLESTNPAILVRNLGDPQLENVVERVDFEALGFPGTLTGGSIVGDDLEADGTTAFYGADGAPFYGADADPFYEDEVYEEMVYTTGIFYFSIDWVGSSMTLEHVLEGAGVFVEYRQTNEEAFYGADAEDFYGPDAESFYGADGDWRPWPGTITYTGGDVQLRVTTTAGPVQGAVRELSMVIDVPDIVEEFENVSIPPGGARLAPTKDFDHIKTVQLTLQDDGGAAVSARYLDKDPVLGPLVECIDDTQASVAGILDATLTGR